MLRAPARSRRMASSALGDLGAAVRFHYLSDLHLEAQDFLLSLERGDVLIVAGDLCHARTFEAAPDDGYARLQRERVLRFADKARANYPRIILIPGNHDHYDVASDGVGLSARPCGRGLPIYPPGLQWINENGWAPR